VSPPFPRRRWRADRGVSLIEVVVALTLLSVVLLALTGIMWEMGRHTRQASLIGARGAALASAASLAESMRWDSLDALVGCGSDTSAQMVYTRCFEVGAVSSGVRQVRAIVTPAGGAIRPETLTVSRTRPRSRSPLYVP
jgi:prepilin-type N-terminal cleavage/methylation domain-containing protein